MHHDSPRHVSSKNPGFHGDQAWAHWEYSPEEWAVFDRVDWRAAWLRYWLPNLIPPVCLFILCVFFFHVNVFTMLLALVAFALPPLAAVFIVRGYFYREAKLRQQARQNRAQPHRVTFSKEGVWEAGTYFPLTGVFLSLQDVHMTSQPAVLHFRRKRLIRNNYMYDTLRVLVPRGHEEEATRLIERFRTEVIEAKKPTYSPPEPV
jgi:hypothetical protein